MGEFQISREDFCQLFRPGAITDELWTRSMVVRLTVNGTSAGDLAYGFGVILRNLDVRRVPNVHRAAKGLKWVAEQLYQSAAEPGFWDTALIKACELVGSYAGDFNLSEQAISELYDFLDTWCSVTTQEVGATDQCPRTVD